MPSAAGLVQEATTDLPFSGSEPSEERSTATRHVRQEPPGDVRGSQQRGKVAARACTAAKTDAPEAISTPCPSTVTPHGYSSPA